jgi:hypothetical protein
MASKDSRMSKQGPAGKRKNTTLTVPRKVEIIRRLESAKSFYVVMFAYNTGLSAVCDTKKQKDQS